MKKQIYTLLLSAVVIITACKKDNEPAAVSTPQEKDRVTFNQEQLKQLVIKPVELMPIAEEFTAVGEVSFDEDNVVRVYPIVSGGVETVEVSLGDYVKSGQLLATILSTDITSYQRDYNVAKADLEVAEKNMKRADELYSSGMMSEKDFTEVKKDHANAKSNFNEKRQILSLYGGSPDKLDATFRVVAPRSGFIVERNINQGTQIRTDNSTNIFTISDLKTVWIWANVHESDMGKVREGDKVVVKTIAYPDKTFTGEIKKMGTMLDPSSRVIRVRSELENEDGLLKPEMFATIIITSATKEKLLAVPNKAMVLENNNFYVMKETKPGTFEKVKVTTGKKFSEFTEVTEGLNAGDKVIIEGSLFALTAFNQIN